MLEANFTNQFAKDTKLMQKQGRDLDDLFDILIKIIWEEPLPANSKVTFVRTGTHSELY